MNHGYCKNCWWWEPIKFDLKEARWTLGICWCWKNQIRHDSYCPDYCNRKREDKKNGTLEEWIKNIPETYEVPEGSRLVERLKKKGSPQE